jgi:hypothetical protein
MIKLTLTKYKDYQIGDDGQGNTQIFDKDMNLIHKTINLLAAKMWLEINVYGAFD